MDKGQKWVSYHPTRLLNFYRMDRLLTVFLFTTILTSLNKFHLYTFPWTRNLSITSWLSRPISKPQTVSL